MSVRYAASQHGYHNTLLKALRATTAEECFAALTEASDRFDAFREAMPEALRGEWSAVVVMVNLWQTLIDDVVSSAAVELPDLVRAVDDHFGFVTASHAVSAEPIAYLRHLIEDVPFSPFMALWGQDIGVGVVAVDAIRSFLPGWPQLHVERSLGWPELPNGANPDRYRRLVDLAIRGLDPPLVRVKRLFGLSNTELATLFGVTRQALDQWERSGEVPTARREKLANLLSVGEVLGRKLKPGRLPLVARRTADAYGGISLLDMVMSDRDSELRELTERALDWSSTA